MQYRFKAGLPASTFPAFRDAIVAMHEDVLLGETRDASLASPPACWIILAKP